MIKIIIGVSEKNKFFIIKSEISRMVVSENIITNIPVTNVVMVRLK